jgi:hypothetical protein
MTMHLLIGFDDDERIRPAVYELLIAMLQHSRVGIRELSHWHLVRLVPDGRDIAYSATASDDERARAVERWRQLIPAGELPKRPKAQEK